MDTPFLATGCINLSKSQYTPQKNAVAMCQQ